MTIASLDKWLGHEPGEDIRWLWYRRAVLAFATMFFVFSVVTATLVPLPSQYEWPGASLFLYLSLYVAAVATLRFPVTYRLSGWVLVLASYGASLDFMIGTDGLMGHGAAVMIVLPLVGTFLLGLRGMAILGVLCVAAVVFSYWGMPSSEVSAEVTFKAALMVMLVIVTTVAGAGMIGTTRSMIGDAETSRNAATLASDAKSSFLANVSHEIRTPLNGVIAMSEAVLNDPLPHEARERIRVIKDSGQLLLHIINDVLDVSKIEAGAFELDVQPFNGKNILERVQALYAPLAQAKGVSLVFEEPDYAVPMRLGDEHRVVQIISNLVSNAIKFTEHGEVRIKKEACRRGVRFSVSDTGRGMTKQQAAAAMEAFNQVDVGISRQHGGTGLGLAIVQGLVQLMEGELTIKTAPGEGSTFHVFLPLPPILNSAQETNKPTSLSDARPQLAGRALLVVDDNEVNLMVARALLGPTEAEITEARSGEEGLELALARKFDAILLDISMPGMDGPEVLRRLRDRPNPNQTAPIIAVTAHAMKHQEKAFLAQGFDGFISKPISSERLYDELLRHIDDGQAPGELASERLLNDILRRRSI